MDLLVQAIRERAQLPLSAPEWRALVSGNETDTVFQTFEWFDAWWNTFGHRHQLYFLVVRSEGRVIGFAPLMIARTPSRLGWLEFVGTGNADYQDFVLPTRKREALQAICAFLRADSSSWQRAWLCNIPKTSSTLRYIREDSRTQGLYLVEETVVPCPVLRLEGADDAVGKLLGKYSMRRPLNWFSRRGEVRFRHVTDPQEIGTLLPQFFDQHVRRWNAVGRPSLFQDGQQRDFFRNLALAARDTGWLQFSVLQVGNESIAFHLGFDYRGSIVWYKPSFEVSYAEHSPGLLLIRKLIEDAVGRGRVEVDFTIGGEPFKQRFANTHRHNVYVGLYHNRTQHLFGQVEKSLRGVAGTILRSLQNAARGLPKLVSGGRR